MKIGFIGCGNMARAIIGGLKMSGVDENAIIASAKTEKTRNEAEKEFGIRTTEDNKTVCDESDVIILAVKPQIIDGVLPEVKEHISSDKLIISIIAGKDIKYFEDIFGTDKKIVRAMPNTPSLVGSGMTGYCLNGNVTDSDAVKARIVLESFGMAEQVPEKMMEAVTAVSGSSPAFVFMFIEALADGAVLEGLPRDKALKFAAQAVMGSAKLVLESGKHPGELKDMVCSPGGTTIEGVRTLEVGGLRGNVINAVHDTAEKSRNL